MNRRGFLSSILAAGMAPAAIGSGVLMPVRQIWTPHRVLTPELIAQEAFRILSTSIDLDVLNGAYRKMYYANLAESIKVQKILYQDIIRQ